ncbi:IS630 family transposase [Halomonas sp. TBZ9]|uniref:IS630 family transposase n=1 Tax=Vreelandella azerica TaxID=2732867 RepID=A0A7Y3TYF3_9GAMM|nr:IS630 family transposase [Halomonas azerica]NOG31886.1 IS630 family transposase [Halomonas azerica]NOG31887.1 IS630 family transposase [Halomonas azerica]NOG32498.1 IS630 family transposase [Halomonas azerica]
MSKPLRFISLTPDQQRIVNNAYQYGEKRALRRRAHAILLSHKGHTINQIRDILGVKRDTVSTWLSQWEADGIDGLQDKPRDGRPNLLNDGEIALLQQLVEDHPHQLPVLHAKFQEKTGKVVSRDTLRRALKKNGNSCKRVRYSLKARRDETDFRNTQGLINALKEWEDSGTCDLYFFDETGFSQSSSLPYAWSPIGQPWEVTAYSHSKRLNVLGFLSRKGMFFHHMTMDTVNSETVIEAFDQFAAQKDPDAFAVVVLDNAKMHHSKAFRRKIIDWMTHRIHLIYLSPYSPELNLIEILWREIKYRWLPLTAYSSFDRLCQAVKGVCNGYGVDNTITFA